LINTQQSKWMIGGSLIRKIRWI